MSRILDINRAIELGRSEQELYRKINCLDDQSSTGLFLEYAERLLHILSEEARLIWDGTFHNLSREETDVLLKRIDELEELIEKVEQLRRHIGIVGDEAQ